MVIMGYAKEYVDSITEFLNAREAIQEMANIVDIRRIFGDDNMSYDDMLRFSDVNLKHITFLMRIGAEVVTNEDIMTKLPDDFSAWIQQRATELSNEENELWDIIPTEEEEDT